MSLSQPIKATNTKRKTLEDDDEIEKEQVNVDFDFFDITEIDYHAIKHLLVQLFHSDSEHLELHSLTDYILSQNDIGSTIKVDGKESDPFAFMTAINLNKARENSSIDKLANYFLDRSKASTCPQLHDTLNNLLNDSNNDTGLILGERLVNMPVVLIPHMLRFLLEELKTASEHGKPFKFSHYLIVSRTYIDNDQDMDLDDEGGPSKKKKSDKNDSKLQSFHPEDEITQDHTNLVGDYSFQHVVNKEQDASGADIRGRLILIEANKMKDILENMLNVITM